MSCIFTMLTQGKLRVSPISNEAQQHGAKSISELLKKMSLKVKLLVPSVTNECSQWINQRPNTGIRPFSKSLAIILSRHVKGPCDPIRVTTKRQVDMAVRHRKVVTQDALDLFTLASS